MRVERTTIQTLLGLLTYLNMGVGVTLQNAIRWVRVRHDTDPSLVEALEGIPDNFDGDEMIDEITKMIMADKHGTNHDLTLIDEIVKLLTEPYPRNRLGLIELRQLRKAFLIPSEMVGLIDRLKRKECSCASCGIALFDNEAVTACMTEEGMTFNCFRCRKPTVTGCLKTDCTKCIPFYDQFTFKKKSTTCPHKEAPDPIPTLVRVEPEALRFVREEAPVPLEHRRARTVFRWEPPNENP